MNLYIKYVILGIRLNRSVGLKNFICIFLMMTTISLNAKIWYVSVNGNDSSNGRSYDTSFKTISKALSVMWAGDKIYVLGGTYFCNLTINIPKSGFQYLHVLIS